MDHLHARCKRPHVQCRTGSTGTGAVMFEADVYGMVATGTA